MVTQTKQLKGFVSAPPGTDLSILLEVLEKNNINILDPNDFAPGAVQITDKIIDGIGNADLIIAVLGTDIASPNVFLELGCAIGLGKKTLLIAPENSKIPSDLAGLLYIKSGLNNREAIDFALEQIINAPEQKTNKKALLVEKSKPLGNVADNLLQHLDVIKQDLSEHDIKNIVQKILKASGVETLREPGYSAIIPDFAVWIDELEPYFGNPILIEVQKDLLTVRKTQYIVQQVLHYMSLNNTMAVIIFAFQISSEARKFVSSYPNLYCFEVGDLLKRLKEESLGKIIRKERNARFHGRI